jgi:hypothetical protein
MDLAPQILELLAKGDGLKAEAVFHLLAAKRYLSFGGIAGGSRAPRPKRAESLRPSTCALLEGRKKKGHVSFWPKRSVPKSSISSGYPVKTTSIFPFACGSAAFVCFAVNTNNRPRTRTRKNLFSNCLPNAGQRSERVIKKKRTRIFFGQSDRGRNHPVHPVIRSKTPLFPFAGGSAAFAPFSGQSPKSSSFSYNEPVE